MHSQIWVLVKRARVSVCVRVRVRMCMCEIESLKERIRAQVNNMIFPLFPYEGKNIEDPLEDIRTGEIHSLQHSWSKKLPNRS